MLDAFSNGKGDLPSSVKKKLAKELFGGHAVYDETIDMLRPAVEQEPTPLGIGASQVKRKTEPPASYQGGPQPVEKRPSAAPKVTRPGWVE